MELVYLLIGTAVGAALSYLMTARKASVLQARLQMQEAHAAEMLKAERQQAAMLLEQQKKETELLRRQNEETNRLLTETRQTLSVTQTEKLGLEEKLENQKKELTELHKQFNLEFENIANKIFQQKTESFMSLSLILLC